MKALGLIAFVFLFVFVLILTGGGRSNGAPQTATAPQISAPDPAEAARCQSVMDWAIKNGLVTSYEASDGYGSVVVGLGFDSASFEDKQSLDRVARCVMTQGRHDRAGLQYVEYLDYRSHKELAKWSEVTGFSVD